MSDDPSPLDPTDSDSWPEFMTPGEVAQVLRVTQRTVNDMVNRGEIPATEMGNRRRISKRWLITHHHGGGGNPQRPPR